MRVAGCLSMSWQVLCIPNFWSSPCGPRTPWGMALVPACPSLQPKGSTEAQLWPECRNTTVGRDALSSSHSSATAYTKAFQASTPEENEKKKVLCSVYSANSDKGFGVISSTLFPQFLVCDLYRVLNVYFQGHPHWLFFNQEDAVLLFISFSFFLQVQEFFVLLGTPAVLCCLIKYQKWWLFYCSDFFLPEYDVSFIPPLAFDAIFLISFLKTSTPLK